VPDTSGDKEYNGVEGFPRVLGDSLVRHQPPVREGGVCQQYQRPPSARPQEDGPHLIVHTTEEKATGCLSTLIAKGTRVIILEPMLVLSVRGPTMILQHEPTKEFVLFGRLGLLELPGTQELRGAKEHGPVSGTCQVRARLRPTPKNPIDRASVQGGPLQMLLELKILP
jgi:hypothetical protein